MKPLLLLLALFVFGPEPAHASTWTITASGIITGDQGAGPADGTGIFGTPGVSLAGDAYTETITTDPLVNTGGLNIGGCCASPYTITVTVNGFTYTQTELNPYTNYSYLISGLSSGLASQDQVYQGVSSSQCYSVVGLCTNSYILAYSTQTPFVPGLDFGQSI